MMTLVEKSLLVKFFNLSQESAAVTLRMFRTEQKMKKMTGPITPAALISLMRRFGETGCLQKRSRSYAPRLSEDRNSLQFPK